MSARVRLFVLVGVAVIAFLVWSLTTDDVNFSTSPGPAAASGRVDEAPPTRSVPRPASRRVAGRVLSNGVGQANAVVHIESSDLSRANKLMTLVTDAEGRFDAGSWPLVSIHVGAIAIARTARTVEVDLRQPALDSEHLEIVLSDCVFAVRGHVLDSGAGVVGGAFVQVALGPGVITAQDGSYSMCLPRGPQQLVVSASGYGPVTTNLVVFGRHTVDFTLQPSALIRGFVETSAGRPVPLAHVVAFAPLGGQRPAIVRGRANQDAQFQLEVAAGEFAVSASAPGYATINRAQIAVRPTETTDPIRVEVEPVARVAGKLMLKDNAPASGATVWLTSTRSRLSSSRAVSDAEGNFLIEYALPEPSLANVDGFEVINPQAIVPSPEGTEHARVVVRRRAHVRARVVKDGSPAEGAEIKVVGFRSSFYTSDVRGEALLQGLEPGAYSVSACDDSGLACSRVEKFEFPCSDDSTIELQLTYAGGVSGRVETASGASVADVALRCAGKSVSADTVSDENGEFRCSGLRAGSYEIKILSHGKPARQEEPASVNLRDDREEVTNFTVRVVVGSAQLRGRVFDHEKNPVADVTVRVAVNARVLTAKTSSSGEFRFDDLPNERLNISASDPLWGDAAESVQPGEDVVLTLTPRANVEVRTVGFSSLPVVRAQELTTRIVNSASYVKGQHTLRLPAGEFVLTAAARGGEGHASKLVVSKNQSVRVTVERRQTARVTGTIRLFGSRTPVRAARCGAIAAVDGQAGAGSLFEVEVAESDADGRFVLNAPSGEILVACGSALFGNSSRLVTAPLADPIVFELPGVSAQGQSCGMEFDPTLQYPQVVASVAPRSRAAVAGFQVGDRVLALDGESTRSLDISGLQVLLDSAAAPPVIQLERAGERLQLTLVQ